MSPEVKTAAMSNPSATDGALDPIVKELTVSPEADEFLRKLVADSGLSEGNVLLFALGMFRTAIDAKQQGKHVGVAHKSEDLEIELVGF